jgi:hypothetical protein
MDMVRTPTLALLAVALPLGAAGAPPRLTFRTTFSGVAPDGEHCLWQGPVTGAVRGRLTIGLRQVEAPAAAANPIWHVATRWSVGDSGAVPQFAADLEGMIDWKTASAHLGGVVAEGWQRGAWVHVDGRFVNDELVGSVTLAATPRR